MSKLIYCLRLPIQYRICVRRKVLALCQKTLILQCHDFWGWPQNNIQQYRKGVKFPLNFYLLAFCKFNSIDTFFLFKKDFGKALTFSQCGQCQCNFYSFLTTFAMVMWTECIKSDSQNLACMKVNDRKSVLRSHFFNFQAFAKTFFRCTHFSLVWTSSHTWHSWL